MSSDDHLNATMLPYKLQSYVDILDNFKTLFEFRRLSIKNVLSSANSH